MNVLLVGCGNFGLRWLDELKNNSEISDISVIDPIFKNKELKNKISAKYKSKATINFFYELDLVKISNVFRICIIATNSNNRLDLVREILSKNIIVDIYVLEKILAQSLDDLDELQSLLANEKVYINYNMRYQPISYFISKPSSIRVEGGKFDFTSNCFHYLDFAEFIYKSQSTEIKVINGLNVWYPSKVRPNFLTTDGEIHCNFSDSKSLDMIWNNKSSSKIFINSSDNVLFFIDECKLISTIKFRTNKSKEVQLPWLHFSEMSYLIISDLINGRSKLPTLNKAYNHTKLLLESLSRKYIYFKYDKSDKQYLYSELKKIKLPIT